MEISLLALKYFQKAAQLQHLTKAAAQLHIAQPSLSRTIRGLEETFGVPLFDRQGRKLVLNAYGKILLKHTNHILLSMDNLYQEIGNICQENDSTVTLSVCAASEIIPGLLKDFQKDYPGTRVQILQYDSASADASKSDLTVFSSITPIDNSHCTTLLEEEIMLAIPVSNYRAFLPSVSLSSLSTESFISLQPGKNLRTITDFYCYMAGFTPKIDLECDSPGTARDFIRAGLGISFVPSITWRSVAGKNLALVPIESPHCRRYIGLMCQNGTNALSRAARSLQEFFMTHFAEYAIQYASQFP